MLADTAHCGVGRGEDSPDFASTLVMAGKILSARAIPHAAAITPRLMLPCTNHFSRRGLVSLRSKYHGMAAYHKSTPTLVPAATCIHVVAASMLAHSRVSPASSPKQRAQ